MHYDTALRAYPSKLIEQIDSADILVGIPCFNNEKTIAHVIQMVSHGLAKYYNDQRCVIFIADGGSTDDTRQVAREVQSKPWQEKIVSIYRGPRGKGAALRSVFEAAKRLKIQICAIVDPDIQTITSDWVKYLINPILEQGYQFVAPVYLRHKYDGSITNNLVYHLTRALYGRRVRQPMGGDFAFSRDVNNFYGEQDVWETDVVRYGIDIWITTNALIQGFRICQANLGVKIHEGIYPELHLGPIFRQGLWSVFFLMERFERGWKTVRGSEPVETFGYEGYVEPEFPVVDLEGIVEHFKVGYRQFSQFWKSVFSYDCFEEIRNASEMDTKRFHLSIDVWVRILYELAAVFHTWSSNRYRLIDVMTPLYYARIASFIRQSWEMSSSEAEDLVEKQAMKFEEQKEYLIQVWDKEY
jgi:glycosyltransferase involved in cell wall biosynthesis